MKKIDLNIFTKKQLLEIDACTRCGKCVESCPTYEIEKSEGINPRGKAKKFKKIIDSQYGIRSIIPGGNNLPDDFLHDFLIDLYRCTVCAQCRVLCPLRIDTAELWETIRASLVDAGLAPLDVHKPFIASIKSYDNPWQQPRSMRDRWAKKAFQEGLLTAPVKDITKEKADVLLYIGCTGSYDVNIKEMAINAASLLLKLGVDFGILGNKEKCCGSTLKRVGDREYERLAKENIEMFNKTGAKILLTICSGCFKTIKENYKNTGKLKLEVLHITEFLDKKLAEGKIKFSGELNATVTYHDPCHLGRHSGVFEPPRNLIKAIPGMKLVEMERIRENSRCCGSGGGVKAGFPHIQQAISLDRVKEAMRTGARYLVTSCPFCYQSLKDALQKANSVMEMKDVTALLNQVIL